MKQVRYFAYGSNLDADQMRVRCPTSQPVGLARLDHHRIDFTHFSRRWRGGAADVVPDSGEAVWGVVYALEEIDLVRLDRFEAGYERVFLEVAAVGGASDRVITYTVRQKGSFQPTSEYLDKMLRWGERHEFPDTYLLRLRAFANGSQA